MARQLIHLLFALTVSFSIFWAIATSLIHQFKCPAMTRTELILATPQTLLLDFTCTSDRRAK